MASSSGGNTSCISELPAFCQQRHWSIYWILIACSFAVVCGRIATVKNHAVDQETGFFSANDRSRWATIRALGDYGTYEIDGVIQAGQPIRWDTIDKVKHLGADGKMHSYSSKPPLLPSLIAMKYRMLNRLTGKNLAEDTLLVTRVLLLTTNGLPWLVFLYTLAKTIDYIPVRDWSRYYVLACAGFGTFLSTFAVTLNNHLPAAIATMITIFLMAKINRGPDTRLPQPTVRSYFGLGLAASFAFVNELPALSLLAIAGFLCVVKSFRWTIVGFMPAVALVVGAFFGCNYLAHGTWVPAYAHRSDGEVIKVLSTDQTDAIVEQLGDQQVPQAVVDVLPEPLKFSSAEVVPGDWPSTPETAVRWVVRDHVSDLQYVVVHDLEKNHIIVREWGNWYEYRGSYWLTSNYQKKSLVDRGQQDQLTYLFHVLIGHHGIFSLTPIWVLAIAGLITVSISGELGLKWLGIVGLVLTVVVVAFYVDRPAIDRNYGGVSSGLRWGFWLIPFWLVGMLPIADWLGQSKWGRCLCWVALVASAASAFYSHLNPWVNPWLYEVWGLTGLPV